MKLLIATCVVAGLFLSACQKAEEPPAPVASGFAAKGRFLLSERYVPGRLWQQIARSTDPNTAPDPSAAVLKDDEQILVVVDTKSGEIRQCGNLSGYCTRITPWARSMPVPLRKHREQLEQEDAAAEAAEAKAFATRTSRKPAT